MLATALSASCGKKPKPSAPTVPKVSEKLLRNCFDKIRPEAPSHSNGRTYHVLREGETVYRLSKMYGASVHEIIDANGIRDHTDIEIGTRIFIPGFRAGSHMSWPIFGYISSGFGRRWGRLHTGIDIPAPRGTPIRAASGGFVVASLSGVRGYGRLVIIEHEGKVRTYYAHNRKNHVKFGNCIRAGDIIAEVGKTGNATGPHLHFEVRKNGNPVNPLEHLP